MGSAVKSAEQVVGVGVGWGVEDSQLSKVLDISIIRARTANFLMIPVLNLFKFNYNTTGCSLGEQYHKRGFDFKKTIGYNLLLEVAELRKKDIIEVTDRPIIPEKVIAKVKGAECGAVVTFTGKVRGSSGDKKVTYLEHGVQGEAPEKMLKDIVGEIRRKWDVGEIAFCYRKGKIRPGEVTIVIAVAAIHRQEAFAACLHAVDRLKQKVVTKEGREGGEVRVAKKG